MRIELKTTRGGVVEVDVHDGSTVDDVCKLLAEKHSYNPSVRLMLGSSLLDGHRYVDEFPPSSLLIVGAPAAPRDRSPQSKIRMTHHHGHPHAQESSSVETEQAPRTSPTSSQVERVVYRCVVPMLQKAVDVDLAPNATVADLVTAAVATDVRLVGCKVVFRGKPIGRPDALLHSLGLRPGDAVHIATGVYKDMNILNLFRIQEDLTRVERQVHAGLSETERKSLYEELMRVLFRTDELQDLEGEWKAQRKELVKRITSLQDSLRTHV